jgi:VIT1/CCC1 family predicted Fe2+/Mn2+ transporter
VTDKPKKESFVRKYLDPASRLGEILFGLIMVLTATLTAGLTVAEGKAGVHQLLLSALGCNIAWGIIDAIMYIMNCITERGRRARLLQKIQSAPDSQTALDLIRDEVEPEFESVTTQEDRDTFYQSILKHAAQVESSKPGVLTREDLYGALACFWLVFISCLPAAVPFLIFSKPAVALRVSNFLLIAMLFWVGQKWAKYAQTNRLVTGLAMVAIGLALVGVAVLLGG